MHRTQGILLGTLIAVSVVVAIPPLLQESSGVARADGAAVDAPTVSTLAPMRDGFKWGITHLDVITAFNKPGGVFDQDFDPLLRRAQPGVQQQALEADRDNKKAAIERSYLRFVTPTGYDSTGIKGEYTYGNNEAIVFVERQAKKRYFFFMGAEPNERLWKIYDEIPLSEAGPLGKTFTEAVNRVQGILGVAGRARPQDPASGIDFMTVDWQDGQTHLRVIDRGKNLVGVVLEERATLNALPQLRANKAEDPMAMDPSIAAATRGSISDPSHLGTAPSASASAKKKK
ncbi:MAG: hypothetical protein ACLQVI_19445 [Polyangiaceae bacterium]|jgi:hypothetical protein